ncbi:syntaxin ufe1 [Microsporum audouinii]
MTDLTPAVNDLLRSRGSSMLSGEAIKPSDLQVDEFLKEAHRINFHISSLLAYLKSIRTAYLSTAPARATFGHHADFNPNLLNPGSISTHLTDPERDAIDASTASLLQDLSRSIGNLASAESLRCQTQASVLRKKYGHGRLNERLWQWAGGGGAVEVPRTPEQEEAEDMEKNVAGIRESVLWFLRRGLEAAAAVQREMVEKRIERAREKEKSVLYKAKAGQVAVDGAGSGGMYDGGNGQGGDTLRGRDVSIDEKEAAAIESQLSPEQLQLFAQENDGMLKYYEDTLGKVQNAEKSLLEISSLQQTLVAHLATQEDYINQLVRDADTTHANVGRGNKELKRASERRSEAQMVFWATVVLCAWLILWDAIF